MFVLMPSVAIAIPLADKVHVEGGPAFFDLGCRKGHYLVENLS